MGKHMSVMNHSGKWTYSFCESCAKNVHEDVKMIREIVLSKSGVKEEMWVCPQCGSTKRF